MQTPSTLDRFNSWARNSVSLKLVAIGFLILILLIPSSMIDSLIYERMNLRDEATEEVSSKWGGRQTLGGPVLTIPYYTYVKNDKGHFKLKANLARKNDTEASTLLFYTMLN